MSMSWSLAPFRKASPGFSLVELLTVIAIVAILGTLVGASTGTSAGRRIEAAGLKVAELLELARQSAVTRDAMVAVVLTKGEKPHIGLFELRARPDGTAAINQDWIQAGRWESLPDGLVVDQETLRPGTETFAAGPPVPIMQGKTITPEDFSYAIFLPSGRLMSGTPVALRLVAGAGDSVNYFKLTVISATGRVKIDRR